jgi:hypothetical protein
MSWDCVTCCMNWMKINEIHVSFGEVLWWLCMRSWPVSVLKMSFCRWCCDICVLQTTFLSLIEFLWYDATWVLFRMARFYRSTIYATLLPPCEYTNVLHAEKMLCCFSLSKWILEECEKLRLFAILGRCQRSRHCLNIVTIILGTWCVFAVVHKRVFMWTYVL